VLLVAFALSEKVLDITDFVKTEIMVLIYMFQFFFLGMHFFFFLIVYLLNY
jgi:hypothetical protein